YVFLDWLLGICLQWMDKEGKTPLIVACLRHDLLPVAKALIEMGANVNAYRPGEKFILVPYSGFRARYKFLAASEGDKQQLRWFFSACQGISQVFLHVMVSTPAMSTGTSVPSPPQVISHASTQSTAAPTSNPEDIGLEMAINAPTQTTIAEGMPYIQSDPQTSNTNGWASSSDNSSYNGWGTPDVGAPSKVSGQVLMNEPNTINGWAVPEVQLNTNALQPCMPNPETVQSSPGVPSTQVVPSAPPMAADTFYDGPIHYPSIDFSPIDLSMPVVKTAPGTAEAKDSSTSSLSKTGTGEDEAGSSSTSCVICLDAPVEGACIPCGHMAGCMSCLREIEAKNWGCPVCRTKINQIIKLYAV
ncbi:hypothetical protein BHE74_00049135, partial [Ensete ventricosum]